MTADAPQQARPGPSEVADATHWERIYRERPVGSLSWFAPHLEHSLAMITEVAGPDDAIIDVGAGAATLVDDLLDRGYHRVDALDISPAALGIAAERLGARAATVRWHAADIRRTELPAAAYDLWHDRAVYHFLTDPVDRAAYRDRLLGALRPGGRLVIATFALDGPTRCSGLPVVRHDAASLGGELGNALELETSRPVSHLTPTGAEQRFLYCRFRRRPGS